MQQSFVLSRHQVRDLFEAGRLSEKSSESRLELENRKPTENGRTPRVRVGRKQQRQHENRPKFPPRRERVGDRDRARDNRDGTCTGYRAELENRGRTAIEQSGNKSCGNLDGTCTKAELSEQRKYINAPTVMNSNEQYEKLRQTVQRTV